ncbi:MAG: tRNA (N6-isopentenyl adenosine(37)-C2)-methylthiotransferase MiaB [Spirochaetia bacterium]|jgi:tRNA-2-methylthio-N6-dimethylallyladenosine synthase|nr:tRNA (N6-isopentenyl adenosine(37)-C2)-methylthiotransferase MiaB [Spirochaetia bacterium]
MRRFWLETYGCQMNKAESNALEGQMLDSGWVPASAAEDADLVILNTCSVRLTAENRIWGRLGYFKKLKETRPHTLVVMGCMAERLKGEIKKTVPAVDMVVGTFQKADFARLLGQAACGRHALAAEGLQSEGRGREGAYAFQARHSRKNDYRAFVPIMHGCDNFCSYCIVPFVRGREVSRDPHSIFGEIGGLLREGRVKEITLLGQNVNSYRFQDLDFPGLLEELFRRFPDAPWIRFLTSHPKDFSPALAKCMASHRAMCRHIHLPVQHGSDTILAAMNRQYTRGAYLALTETIREALPDVLLSTDLLIGFPGETDKDFQDTLDLIRAVRFDDAFTYYYNPRQGTAAWKMPDSVPEKLKLERLRELIEVQKGISREKKKQRLGTTVDVLAEGASKKNSAEILGRTEGDEMVVFPGQGAGDFRKVRLDQLKGNTFYAHEVSR